MPNVRYSEVLLCSNIKENKCPFFCIKDKALDMSLQLIFHNCSKPVMNFFVAGQRQFLWVWVDLRICYCFLVAGWFQMEFSGSYRKFQRICILQFQYEDRHLIKISMYKQFFFFFSFFLEIERFLNRTIIFVFPATICRLKCV